MRMLTISCCWLCVPIDVQSDAPCIAVMHAGASAPGMNTAVRAAVRLALDKGASLVSVRYSLMMRAYLTTCSALWWPEGFRVFAVYEGFEGLVRGEVREVDWMTVNGWSSIGGSLLGTSRAAPKVSTSLSLCLVPPPKRTESSHK